MMNMENEKSHEIKKIVKKRVDDYLMENGITINNNCYKSIQPPQGRKLPLHNPKMAVCREITLATLKVFSQASHMIPCCLEALATSGLAAMQWKKCLGNSIHVTCAVSEPINQLEENCKLNNLKHQQLDLDFNRTPGTPFSEQDKNEIQICLCKANVLLHMESFDFIYLDPHKNCSSFMDSTFFNLRHLGVLCLIVPDISMFARSHHVVERNFSASVIKTDYIKELAARIILGQLQRSASKCNKGLEVLYVLSVDDFLLICVKSHRGPHVADNANKFQRFLLHCRICEERIFIPRQIAPSENPYASLPCSCHEEKTGKTAVILGPMWSGPIFNWSFLSKMKDSCEELNMSLKTIGLIDCMKEECEEWKAEEKTHLPEENQVLLKSEKKAMWDGETKSESCVINQAVPIPLSSTVHKCKKRSGDENIHQSPIKRAKRANVKNLEETDLWSQPFLPFYYNTHKWKVSHTKLPKIGNLVQLLRSVGYKATRTHFDSKSVRTNAPLSDIKAIIDKHYLVNL